MTNDLLDASIWEEAWKNAVQISAESSRPHHLFK